MPDDWNPGECAVGIPWRGCSGNAACWRWWDRVPGSTSGTIGDWYGNGVCIPSTWQRGGFLGLGGRWIPNDCLPSGIWAYTGTTATMVSFMKEHCCNVRRCFESIRPGGEYCVCLPN